MEKVYGVGGVGGRGDMEEGGWVRLYGGVGVE